MASGDAPKTVLLRGQPIGLEGIAGGTITPGMFVALDSDGKVDPAPANSNTRWVARENEIVGKSINDNYSADDTLLYWSCRPGDQVYALLDAGENVSAGALLQVSSTAGVLGSHDPGEPAVVDDAVGFPGNAVARALEAVNNSGGATPVRIRVEVL